MGQEGQGPASQPPGKAIGAPVSPEALCPPRASDPPGASSSWKRLQHLLRV